MPATCLVCHTHRYEASDRLVGLATPHRRLAAADLLAGNDNEGVTMGRPHPPGFDIALAGIDGVGKSTLSAGLATELRRHGYVVTVVSWRDYLRSPASGGQHGAVAAVYRAMIRSLYAALTGPDGEAAEHLLPGLDEDFRNGRAVRMLLDDPSVRVTLNPERLNLLLACGLLEAAARMAERETVIRPALARGEVVIQESHGLKNCVKYGLFAEHLANGDDVSHRTIADYLSVVRRCLVEWSPATVSVLVTADPRLAYAWRKRQNGFISRGEYLETDGRSAEWGFLELQAGVQRALLSIADVEGWPRVTMTEQARELNLASAVGTTLETLADRGILPREMAR
jgi:hypothetical protein